MVAALSSLMTGTGEQCVWGVSHLMGTFLWPWQPLPSFQQLSESQYRHLPLDEAYELDEFLQKKQDKSSAGRTAEAEARSFR